ncbi:hypothetical protein ZIOFF_052708 [Zingiber officinale]|uniref:Aminomethyltransferase, mitochondrial n=1 Tax=Zingiber officinale TaxID=94328 RepID=A0A8J5FP16_ZINOF|nr:hypothetical protein ZIOFF_052708 [Zingiber officinale]
MRGGGLWQLGQCLSRRIAQSKPGSALKPRTFAAAPAAEPAELKKTALYDFHVENGGKMVPFAGWSMPLQYKDSIMDSTLNCRAAGSLFDVSHMCGLSLRGRDAIPFLETLVVADIAGMRPGTGSLTVFTNERGGAIDDSVVTKVQDDHVYLVVNAGCRDKDLAHIGAHMEAFKKKGGVVDWHIHDERSLLALQKSVHTFNDFPFSEILLLVFSSSSSKSNVERLINCVMVGVSILYIARTSYAIFYLKYRKAFVVGFALLCHHFTLPALSHLPECFSYTGEDGFEISVPSEKAVDLAKAILEKSEGKVRPTGLGARDSLRLEAGLCLYGNDMEQHTTPVEAGLSWAIGKRRRKEGGFLGADVILKQLEEGPPVRRVGFFSTGPPPRSHSEILSSNGEKIGEVTSGGFSPCLKKNIAMGYVKSGLHKPGTEVKIIIRGKSNDGVITKMPFVPTKYYKPS